ncbi:MAG: hypothetical protein ABIJ08_01300, partial [Nanoarchaeota archaeon]
KLNKEEINSMSNQFLSYYEWDNTLIPVYNELGFRPSIMKISSSFDQRRYVYGTKGTYTYVTEPPESWGWDGNSLYVKWWNTYADSSILARNSNQSIKNSSEWNDVKINLGRQNASDFYWNLSWNAEYSNYSYIANWTNMGGNISLHINNSAAHSGNLGLVFDTQGNKLYGGVYTQFNVTNSDEVYAACWFKQEAGTTANPTRINRITYTNEPCWGGNYNSTWIDVSYNATSTSTYDWTKAEVSYTVPSNIGCVKILTYINSFDGIFSLDNCTIQINESDVYPGDGDFENVWVSVADYFDFFFYDNAIDTKEDYSLDAQNQTSLVPYVGNLEMMQRMRENNVSIAANAWNHQAHMYKYTDLAMGESIVTQYNAGVRDWKNSQSRYMKMWDSVRFWQYMENPPLFEMYNDIFRYGWSPEENNDV